MRRWLIRTVLLLLIGAMINVAAAWRLALRDDPVMAMIVGPSGTSPPTNWTATSECIRSCVAFDAETHISEQRRRTYFGRTALSEGEFSSVLPDWSLLQYGNPTKTTDQCVRFEELGVGWPAIALMYRRWQFEHAHEDLTVGLLTIPKAWIHDSNDVSFRSIGRRNELPCIPIWPGFYVNTLFYAGAAWLVFFAPFAALRRAKRSRRRRKGLCLHCGYDLRGAAHGACPECGAHSHRCHDSSGAAASRAGALCAIQ